MCFSFTWGAVSVHYLLGLPLADALRTATPNGLMLMVKLLLSPVLLRHIDSSFLPRCFLPANSCFVSHIFGYMAQNAIPRAPSPPAIPHFFLLFWTRLNKFKECNVNSQATAWFKK